jgi:hypothetical protein
MNEARVLQEALGLLSVTPTALPACVRQIPGARTRWKPWPEHWSVLEIVGHMADLEEAVYQKRLQDALAGRPIAAFDQDARAAERRYNEGNLEQFIAQFAKARGDSLALLVRLDPTSLAKTAIHPELGQFTLASLLAEWAAHDLAHLRQILQILMYPFIEASGPWARHLAKHRLTLTTGPRGR